MKSSIMHRIRKFIKRMVAMRIYRKYQELDRMARRAGWKYDMDVHLTIDNRATQKEAHNEP